MRRLGELLLARGLVSAHDLEQALELQETTLVPLGALAVENDILTPQQVAELRAAQKQVDKRLGEIALERDWLTLAQLDRLLKTQRERRVLLGDLLVKQGCLSRAQMNAALADFERLDAEQSARLTALLASLPDSAVIRALLDYTVKHLLRTTGEPVKISSLTYERTLRVNHRGETSYFFSQHASGGRDVTFGLLLTGSSVLRLASGMLDRPHHELDELALDSLCELVNMIVGNCMGRLAEDGVRLRPEPPIWCLAKEAEVGLSGCTRIELLHRHGSLDAVVAVDIPFRGSRDGTDG